MKTSLLRLACPREPDPTFELEITESGRGVLRCLLRRSVPCHAGGFHRTCVAAKLCFLEFLDPDEQLIQMEQLARDYRDHIEALRNRLDPRSTDKSDSRSTDKSDSRSADKSAPCRRLAHEIERFEWELARLDRLRSDMRPALRPEHAQAPDEGRST